MKKTLIIAAVAAITLTSCTGSQQSSTGSMIGNIAGALLGGQTGQSGATTGQTTTSSSKTGIGSSTTSTLAQAGSSLLGNLLGNVLGTNKLTEQNIVGTWQYQGVDCVFESENFLSKAGGEVAAAALEGKVDGYLQKVGIKPGMCSFTFNADHTWRGTLAGKSLSGNWTLDAANKQMHMTYLLGMANLSPRVALNNGQLSLLFESSKLLSLAQGVGALTGNSTVKGLTSLLGNYNGMYIGLQLRK